MKGFTAEDAFKVWHRLHESHTPSFQISKCRISVEMPENKGVLPRFILTMHHSWISLFSFNRLIRLSSCDLLITQYSWATLLGHGNKDNLALINLCTGRKEQYGISIHRK
jgi:hypothetical protein